MDLQQADQFAVSGAYVTWQGIGCRMFGKIVSLPWGTGCAEVTPATRVDITRIDGGLCYVRLDRLEPANPDDVIRACSAGRPGGTLPL